MGFYYKIISKMSHTKKFLSKGESIKSTTIETKKIEKKQKKEYPTLIQILRKK